METIPISSLSQKKVAQLNSAISIPPLYLSVERFEFCEDLNAVLYTIEVGIQNDDVVYKHMVQRRYSALQEFDAQIRPAFGDSKYLHEFPPKKLFGNFDPHFLEKRADKLQEYLGNLCRVAGLCESSVFKRFFEINENLLKEF